MSLAQCQYCDFFGMIKCVFREKQLEMGGEGGGPLFLCSSPFSTRQFSTVSARTMNLLKVMAVFYFCSIIAKSINNVCFDRPPTPANLRKIRGSKCKLADHSAFYLDFFDFKVHYDLIMGLRKARFFGHLRSTNQTINNGG